MPCLVIVFFGSYIVGAPAAAGNYYGLIIQFGVGGIFMAHI